MTIELTVYFFGDDVLLSNTIVVEEVTITVVDNIYQSGGGGSVTSVSALTLGTTGTDVSSTVATETTTPVITLNIPTASAINRGVLSSADWTTFNSKGSGTVTSVGLSMPSAFTVSSSPVTTNGTIAVAGAGLVSQYVRGDGTLANFPTAGGGGSSLSYYLNGSVSQGTLGGVAFKEMDKTPVLGAGTDFTINANGYIQSFITDSGVPNQLLIPAGNWNFEMYFSASSGGGSPSFYVELYKWNGTTLSLIASNSATPEGITNGTQIDLYVSALAVPQTALLATDRLAVRIYVNNSGRTIKLHTEDNHLSQIITTFSTGITALNGLTEQVQSFANDTNVTIVSSSSTHTITWAGTLADSRIASAATWNAKGNGSVTNVSALTLGTSGTDLSSSVATGTTTPVITLNVPTASASNRGALSSTDWSTFNAKANKTGVLQLVGEYLTNTTLTGTTAETSIGYVLIPANTYGAGKTAWVDSLLLRASGTSTIVARMRISTSATPTIASATLLATSNITNTNQYSPFVRTNIHIDSATSTKLYSASTSSVQDNNNTTTVTDLNIDWTVDQYIHVSAQLITSGDSITLHKLRIFL